MHLTQELLHASPTASCLLVEQEPKVLSARQGVLASQLQGLCITLGWVYGLAVMGVYSAYLCFG